MCDLSNSSQYLNDNATAAAIEAFIPRLHWTARAVVAAAGGHFIKWTGDGFLAWFPVELHRNVGRHTVAVFNAAYHLTLLINVTGLKVETEKKFGIRHGITLEHDALVTRMQDDQSESVDLLGRAVVLAFRLSAVKARFPGIVTQQELVYAAREAGYALDFQRWQLKPDERLKYFSGEKWGTTSLYWSTDSKPRAKTLTGIVRMAKKAIAKATEPRPPDARTDDEYQFALAFANQMLNGPAWSKATIKEYQRFTREDLLGVLTNMIPILEKAGSKKWQGGTIHPS